jgi:uncharacterized integral membrane protein
LPTVEFLAFSARDNVKRGESVSVALVITNKSSETLTQLNLKISDGSFEVVTPPSLQTVPAFGSLRPTVVLRAKGNADFIKHSILMTLEYSWGSGKPIASALTTTVSVEVKRPFEDIAPGLPGGSAALFLLLLPLIPAFLSYQLFDRWRRGEGWKWPTFSAEYIVAAVLIVLVANALLVLFNLGAWSVDYSNPLILIIVLLGSFVLGIVVPGGRWLISSRRKSEWGFTNQETMVSYLRKALLSPYTPPSIEWVKRTANGEEWSGLLLKQPEGANVLGARLQVGYQESVSDQEWQTFLTEVIGLDGNVLDKDRLLQMINANVLVLNFDARVMRGEEPLDQVVVVSDQFAEWKGAGGKTSPLINPSS